MILQLTYLKPECRQSLVCLLSVERALSSRSFCNENRLVKLQKYYKKARPKKRRLYGP